MLAAIPLGLAIGVAVGLLGGGGSVMAVPVLVYVLGQGVQEATTTSLVVVAAAALAGGAGHAREGRVCWRHAISFTAAALPGIVAGTLAGDAVGAKVLIAAFAVLMLAAAAATWRKARIDGAAGSDTWEGRDACPPLRMPRDALFGALIGFMTGFFGVGGGFLVVPTLVLAFAFTMRTAVGTSLAIITATSAISLAAHLVAGRSIDPGVTLAMAAACAAGAVAGAALCPRVPQAALGRGFAVLVAAVATYLLVSVALLGGPPGG